MEAGKIKEHYEGRSSITLDSDFQSTSELQVLRLDLASGQQPRPGFTQVDLNIEGALQINLEEFPWPWQTSSVAEINCSHYIEHTPNLDLFMKECHRILQPLGVVTVTAPYWSSIRAWQDPTHKRAITENTLRYYSKEWREKAKVDHYLPEVDFEIVNTIFIFAQEYASRAEDAKMYALKHYINAVEDIVVVLRAKK